MSKTALPQRCTWAQMDPLMMQYHDQEWGVPVHHETRLFEFLLLEGAQAGLTWRTILHKREHYRQAFAGFNPVVVAHYTKQDERRLLANPGIVRNRLKVRAAVINANKFLEVQRVFGSFDHYIWQFVGGTPLTHRWRALSMVPATTRESNAMSTDLKKRGFKFVGPTMCYAFMQAVGMVNDHTTDCFRHDGVSAVR